MTDPFAESRRTAALADKMTQPHEKRMMRMISESWARMARYDAVKMPQYERGD